MIIAEYIWIDGSGDLRSKIKILPPNHWSLHNMPVWYFDGSLTKQASGQQSDVVLRPVALYKNPFHSNGFLVLCDTFIQLDSGELKAHPSNTRYKITEKYIHAEYLHPELELEQEYYIVESSGKPQSFGDSPPKQGKYYCGTVNGFISGRELAERHLQHCIDAGLSMSSLNAGVGPSQWSYQIGPTDCLEALDQLIISRYLLIRVAEAQKAFISFHPKAVGEGWAGSGCFFNFSTLQTRSPGGYARIMQMIEGLSQSHGEFVKNCGMETVQRLIGDAGTSELGSFTWGIGTQNVSVKVPKETFLRAMGSFEDRRPSANVDPYVICYYYLDIK